MLRRTLRVEETLTEVQGKLYFGPPKTSASRRTVTMPKTLVEAIAEHLVRYTVSGEGLVFTGPERGPLRGNHFRKRAWRPSVAASVGQPLRFHDLRHTHAALLIAADQHPKVIQARLGHTSIRTTLDTYGHLYEGLDRDAADALDTMWTERRVGFSWG